MLTHFKKILAHGAAYSPFRSSNLDWESAQNGTLGSTTEIDQQTTQQKLWGLLRCVLLLLPAFFVVYLLRDFLVSVFISLIFFAALFPVFNRRLSFLQSHRRLRSALALMTFTLLCVLPILVTLYSFFLASKEISAAFTPTAVKLTPDGMADTVIDMIEANDFFRASFERFKISYSDVVAAIRHTLLMLRSAAFDAANDFLTALPDTFIKILVVFALLYSLLAHSEDIGIMARQSPLFSQYEKRALFESFLQVAAGTVIGTVLSGIAQASILSTTAFLLGHKSFMLIGAATFLSSFFPLIGTATVSVSLVTYYFINGDVHMALAFAVAGAAASLADNIIMPLVVGYKALVHPLFTLMCALGAIATFGFFGIFIGPVAGAFAMTSLRLLFSKPEAPIIMSDSVNKV